MGKNRDYLCIIAAVLEAAKSGATKTRIMSEANLSFPLLEKYLKIAVSMGFIKAQGQGYGQQYSLTSKGRMFLWRYRHFRLRYENVRKILESIDSEREKLESSAKDPASTWE